MTDIDYSLPKAQVIEGSKHSWELVVGMEVHAQIKSKAKLFSSASTNFGNLLAIAAWSFFTRQILTSLRAR